MKENPTNKLVESAQRQINNRMQKKQNNFEVNYGNRKKVNTEWTNNMKKQSEEFPNGNIQLDSLRKYKE